MASRAWGECDCGQNMEVSVPIARWPLKDYCCRLSISRQRKTQIINKNPKVRNPDHIDISISVIYFTTSLISVVCILLIGAINE